MKLTKRSIDSINFIEKGQQFFWDDSDKGFGLRVTRTKKTFIVQKKLNGRTTRVTIGPYGRYTPEEARKIALTYLCRIEY